MDKINPEHYKGKNGIQSIDVIESFGLNFNLGNVVKYVLRHKNKDGVDDLKKALWYLNREINSNKAQVVRIYNDNDNYTGVLVNGILYYMSDNEVASKPMESVKYSYCHISELEENKELIPTKLYKYITNL